MLERLTDEELIIFLKVRDGQRLTKVETKAALAAIVREFPMYHYDRVMTVKELKG